MTKTTKPSRAKAYVTVHIYGLSDDARYWTIKYRRKRIGGQFFSRKAVKEFLSSRGLEEAQ